MSPEVKRPYGPDGPVIVGDSVGGDISDAMVKHDLKVASEQGAWDRKRIAADWKNVKAFRHAEGWKEYRGKLTEHRWRQVRKAINEFDAIMASTEETVEDLRRLEELMVKVWSIIHRS